ncbi:Programmed cell death protein 7 [Cinara cedri]|uniref:Programmed cell death protein 7 n=1 Tax=Cinara cedri TaxID=506608 RepID=A0A5E4MF50_9HEMI|nr:Programmed cell death protein 7 [Cinara cedri]
MAEKDTYNNPISDTNDNNFSLTCPPAFKHSQSSKLVYNLDCKMPFVHPPNLSLYNKPTLRNPMPYNCDVSNLNHQEHCVPDYQSISTFPPLPDNIDKEYILKYLCPVKNAVKDETFNIWFENWIASKKNKIIPNTKSSNIKIHEISNKVIKCKILLENMKNNKQCMEQNILTMNETEWKNVCSDLYLVKEKLDTLIETLNLDDNSILELKFKLSKRKSKRARLRRFKSNIKIIKLQQKNKVEELNRKIDAWQNSLKAIILKENMVNETKIEANIVLKVIRGKIDDANNQLTLYDTLDKLRKFRLLNRINKRRNPLLEESLNKLKTLWQQKLAYYNREEEELRNMLSQAEAKKNEKREIEIQNKLAKWDEIIFGPNVQSHNIIFDDLHTFLDIRRNWDKYVVNESKTPKCSSIPVGWIIPPKSCNSDWAKYLNKINVL